MEARNLQFCFYYKADDMDVDRFLDLICAHMGKWDPYDYVDRFCRYLLANTNIPLKQRIAYAEKNFIRNHPIHKKLCLSEKKLTCL